MSVRKGESILWIGLQRNESADLGPPPNLDFVPVLVDLRGKGLWTQPVTIEANRTGRAAIPPEQLVSPKEQLANNAQRVTPEARHEIGLGPSPQVRWFQEPPDNPDEPRRGRRIGF